MRHRKRRKNCGLVLLVIALMLLVGSCQTCPPEIEPAKIQIDWPAVPAGDAVLTDDDVTVAIPLDYWLKLVEYFIEVDGIHAILDATIGAAVKIVDGSIIIGGTE